MEITRVTEDYGVKLPLEIWEQIGLKPGDLVEIRIDGGSLVITPSATSFADRLRGIQSEIWNGVDPDEYVRQERDTWGRDGDIEEESKK